MKPILLALTLALSLPVHAERGAHSRREADRVYWICMGDYPGGWESEREWSKDCARIANRRGGGINRARRDHYLGPDRQVEQERRRCIEEPDIIDTSRCVRDADQSGW